MEILTMHLDFSQIYLYIYGSREEDFRRFNIFSPNGHIGSTEGPEPSTLGP